MMLCNILIKIIQKKNLSGKRGRRGTGKGRRDSQRTLGRVLQFVYFRPWFESGKHDFLEYRNRQISLRFTKKKRKKKDEETRGKEGGDDGKLHLFGFSSLA